MAREIHEREDLLRDATALLPRAQLQVSFGDRTEDVFVGFRAGGALSLYFGSDPVYHFNSQSQLRRAYVQDRLIKAVQGRLVSWQPRRNERWTEMLRHDMDPDEQRRFGDSMVQRLHALRHALSSKQYTVTGQVPLDADVARQLTQWLERFREMIVADSARVG